MNETTEKLKKELRDAEIINKAKEEQKKQNESEKR